MTPQVVAPRLSTAAPASSRGSSGLPDDILAEQARRIVLFSGVAAFMWSFGLVMDGLILPAAVGVQQARSVLILEAVAAAVTLAALPVHALHAPAHARRSAAPASG